MTLNQKQFEKLAKAIAISARLSEIERFEGYVSSSQLSARKRTLRKQLAELVGDEEKEERTVNIRIEIPEGEVKPEVKDKKSYSFNLKDLLKGKVNKEDDEDETLIVLRRLVPEELQTVYGKIVKDL
jgi:hypothetical protein